MSEMIERVAREIASGVDQGQSVDHIARAVLNGIGKKVMEVSQAVADGYRKAEGGLLDDAMNEKCATAASNTGWFILQAMGFSSEEIKALKDAK